MCLVQLLIYSAANKSLQKCFLLKSSIFFSWYSLSAHLCLLLPVLPPFRLCVCQLTPLAGSSVEKMPNTSRCQQAQSWLNIHLCASRTPFILSVVCVSACVSIPCVRVLAHMHLNMHMNLASTPAVIASLHTSVQGPIFCHLPSHPFLSV